MLALRTLPAFALAMALSASLLLPSAAGAAPAGGTGSERKVSAWLPWWDQQRGFASFVANADLYRAVSPFWYEMRSATVIDAYPGAGDPTIVDGVRSRGVQVVPTITNDFDGSRVAAMLGAPASRTAHVATIKALVSSGGFDGIDIDYENLRAEDRDLFSAFVSELATTLHASGKILSVTVHPKTSEPGPWAGPQAQDYAAIGASADRVRVMAYDYHWATSAAGAIAPTWWVDQVAAFAVTKIARRKLELGMPLYGYDWRGGVGEGLTWEMATTRIREFGATRRWSSTDGAPWFAYSSNGVPHEVWYEDAASIAAKLPIVDRYGLAGASFWRLGGEDPAVWDAVRARWAPPDALAPTAPTNLRTEAFQRAVKLTWTAAVDSQSGVAGYRIYRSRSRTGGYVLAGETAGSPFRDTGLRRSTTYWYYVVAVDRAGNAGAQSSRVSATTS